MSFPLRIVHVVDYLMPTMGYQESLLPKWNAKHGHDVHIVTSDRYAPISHYEDTWGQMLGPRIRGVGTEQFEGVTVHRLPTTIEWGMRPWLNGLIKTAEGLSPDVIFCHGTASPSAFRLARRAKRSGTPLFMDNHMTYVFQNRSPLGRVYYSALKALSQLLLAGNVNRFLGVADECCRFLETEQGIAPEAIESLPLGVDTGLFRPDEPAGQARRSALGIPSQATVVLQTGKLEAGKGAHLLTKAMAEVVARTPDLWLVFVGSGSPDYVEEVRAPIARAGASDRMVITPFVPVSQLSEVYSMGDICVYPAGESLSCLEAAACGRPVIMTDLPASRWRAEQGVGVCYKTGDVNDLRAAIAGLLDDPPKRQAMGEKARRSVLEHISYDAIARQAEQYMYEAVGEGSRD